MTTHARSPLGVAVCGSRSRLFAFFACEITCKRCKETTRRLRAVQEKGTAHHAPVAASPSGADVDAGNSTNIAQSSGLNAVTSVDRQAPPTGVGAVFSARAASTIPGTCIRKWPHQHAFRFIHTLPNSRIVITKYPSPTQPAWT